MGFAQPCVLNGQLRAGQRGVGSPRSTAESFDTTTYRLLLIKAAVPRNWCVFFCLFVFPVESIDNETARLGPLAAVNVGPVMHKSATVEHS